MQRWLLWTSGLMCFCAGALYGWSALINPVQAAYRVTTAQTGLIFSCAIVSFTAAMILCPVILQEWPPARRLALFGSAAAASVGSAMICDSYLGFVISFGGGFGAMSGAIYITALGVAANSSRHKIATPAMVAAFGAGGAVFGPLWRLLDGQGWGLSSLSFLACVLAIASILVWVFGQGASTIAPLPKPVPMVAVLRRCFGRRFVLIWLTFCFGAFGGLMVLGLASKMMDTAGLTAGIVSIALAGIAIGNALGRLSVAGFLQITRAQNCVFIAVILSTAGFVSVSLQGGLATGLVMIAASYGIIASTIPAITRAAFGPASFQPIFAIMMTAWGVAGFFAPWVSGGIFDRTGSFTGALQLAAVMIALCALTSWRLNRSMRSIQ